MDQPAQHPARRLLSAGTRRARDVAARARLQTHRLAGYRPRSELVLPATEVPRAAVPAVDVHNHLGRWLTGGHAWLAPDVPALLARMDELNIAAIVNLDGRVGDLEANLDRYDRAHPGRFATFAHVEWHRVAEGPAGTATLVRQVEAAARAGAAGLKVWKDLGLLVRDERGALVRPDDPRLGDVFDAAGEAGLPVLVHIGDPPAFFRPVDRFNERLEELTVHPDWSWHGRGVPTHAQLQDAFDALVGAHPGTTFIGAHVAGWAENLQWVGDALDRHPNLVVDTGARLAELGRQPRAAAAFIARHPDRVLWGSDSFPFDPDAVARWFRVLETADEAFDYGPVPDQGRWTVSGLDLPPELLRAVYADNARRVVPALAGPPRAPERDQAAL
ncbi:putative TIM-barrel fold metal-dependent hydrolase [Kineococcus radiotolerans]|uniref:Amidohydrolase 2 n=2 Tax=Kineococcus radiotolerans TaxID=131568 RepID=A6WCJ6_KINRD|nr:amidohydrolase family protein [Kineococcus radiotolerans]ABS04535.1 amidohydrolase 2 [Kineococcus radiotolerans SRS30216 = ATCC BAA-149]MBB2902791.1 putative TIM-barrel fold metal-dependent hydrolase [Kineococcus radiotolerans]